jgi:glycyl-tRNA synthetase beta chain
MTAAQNVSDVDVANANLTGADLLVELGTEELPPKALVRLSEAFHNGMVAGLKRAGLPHSDTTQYASPRRLAVRINALASSVPARATERRGPAVKSAFDADGNPTRAVQGFARSCGVEVETLERLETDEGAWVVFRSMTPAVPAAEVLGEIISDALAKLPIPKRMRWGSSDAEFVRPVRWLVVLHGNDIVPCDILGVSSGRTTHGHRFHCPEPLDIENADDYLEKLRSPGHVVADFAERRNIVRQQVEHVGSETGGHVVIDPDLLDEVTALTEWPVALAGEFESRFLDVPSEALVATMKSNQKYFHVVDDKGALLPHFIAVANLASRKPNSVIKGNERVVRPRLADAQFFYETDLKTPLADRFTMLQSVVFQRKLGSMSDKSQRVAELAAAIAHATDSSGEAAEIARRAGMLSKCDLVTAMVGEFPELQGVMGGRYALASGESEAVASATAEVYLPRFAGDRLPATAAGKAVAVADRLDTLAGIFGIGQLPSGDKDPFALRRAALGVLRILIESPVDVDLYELLKLASAAQPLEADPAKIADDLFDFMLDRLRAYYADRGITAEVFAAVHARRPTRPLDFHRRIEAVESFRKLPAAEALAAANKRIANILRQAQGAVPDAVDATQLAEPAEIALASELNTLAAEVTALLDNAEYSRALTRLADLRASVDNFFDTVRVMDDDDAIRANRLGLLKSIGALFARTADISRL